MIKKIAVATSVALIVFIGVSTLIHAWATILATIAALGTIIAVWRIYQQVLLTPLGKKCHEGVLRYSRQYWHRFNKIVGREHHIRRVFEMVHSSKQSKVLFYSAFAGTGKSYFLNHIYRIRPCRHVYIAHIHDGEAFVSVLRFALKGILADTTYSTARSAIAAAAEAIPNGALFLLDEFQSQNDEFTGDVVFFVEQLRRCGKYVSLVCAARTEPNVFRADFEFDTLLPFTLEETLQFITQRLRRNATLLSEFTAHRQLLYSATGGNPKLIEYLIATPGNWQQLKERPDTRLTSFDDIRALLCEAWTRLGDADPSFQQELKVLATIGAVDETLTDSLCSFVFSATHWREIKRKMLGRRVLETYPEGHYKYHDLFAKYVYRSLPETERKKIHSSLASTYWNGRGTLSSISAFRHALAACEGVLSLTIYREIRRELLEAPNLPQTVSLLDELLALITEPKDIAFLLADIGRSSSMIGRYERAESILGRLTTDFCDYLSPAWQAQISADNAFVLHCRGRFSDAVKLIESNCTIGRIDDNVRYEAECLKAHCLAHLGCFRTSAEMFEKLLVAPGLCPEVEANALWGVAWVRRAVGDYFESEQLARKCLHIALPRNHHRAIGLAYWNLATLSRLKRDFREAEWNYQNSAHHLGLQGIRSAFHVAHEEAELCRMSGQLQRAKILYQRALQSATTIFVDLDYHAHAALGLAETKRLMKEFSPGDYSGCIQYFRENKTGWASLSARVGLYIGQLCFEHRPWNDGEWKLLLDEACQMRFAIEVSTLELIQTSPRDNHIHPLSFM